MLPSWRENKGYGVYFSSHARYQYLWLNHRAPIIICDVLEDEELVKRYRAEIGPGYEFVVKDPKLIIPKCIVEYKVSGDWRDIEELQQGSMWTPPGGFGCPQVTIKKNLNGLVINHILMTIIRR